MRVGIVRSELESLVGVFGGVLQRLVGVIFLLVPENRVIAKDQAIPI